MKNKFLSLAIVGLVMMVWVSCKKPVSELALYVPKDAAAVFTIDPKAITDKLSSSGITIDSLANIFSEKRNEDGLHWSDIQNSGIDLTTPFFIFSKQANSMQGGSMKSFGFIAQIKDQKKVLEFLKKETTNSGEILSGGNYQYMALGGDYVAGWKDKILIISMVTGGTYAPGAYGTGEGTLSQQQLTALFTQNEAASVASVGEFRDMLQKKGDVHFWSNASANMGALGMFGMTKVGTLFQDTYTEGTIDFENGKAVATTESHYNKTLSDILQKYPSREIDKSMVSHYPNPINGFGIVAFNPKVFIDILTYLGFNTMSDSYLSQMGFTTNDVVNAFKGDIAVIFSDFKMEDQAIPGYPGIQSKRPSGQFLVNAVIGDKAAFNRVMTGLVNKQVLSKNGDQYQLGFFGGHDFIIEVNGDHLFIASDDALVKAYESAGTRSALSPDIEKELSNKSMAMYVDIQKILESPKTNQASSDLPDTNKIWQVARSTFKNFIAFADKGNGKTTQGTLQLNTINGNENSLASIAKFLAIAHAEDLKHRKTFDMHPPVEEDSIPGMHEEPEKPDSE